MPLPKLEFPGFEKSGGENASHMDLEGGGEHIYIYICVYMCKAATITPPNRHKAFNFRNP